MHHKDIEKTWIIHWYKLKNAKLPQKNIFQKNILYLISGFHSIYGPNSLLYIGRANNITRRLNEHKWWIKWEQDDITVTIGEVYLFEGWLHYEKNVRSRRFNSHKCDLKELCAIESILISACSPAYNCTDISDPYKMRKNIGSVDHRIFNVGNSAPLPREISTRYLLYTAKECGL